ncbi:3TM-type holin [Terrihabitans sp. B22-R8]|uniref:3TM-type holin n=1 Tax=Terrihabitans sp. B22-R8 TaxID=3425128 RepID=UPI00403C8E7E
MDWASLGRKLIAAGAPAIGGALLGPAGAAAGKILAGVLGAEPTPDAVSQKVDAVPPGEMRKVQEDVIAQWEAMARIAEAETAAQAQTAVVAVEQVNQTIRETAAGDGLLGKWRGVHAWELTAECPLWFLLFAYTVVFDPVALNALVAASGLVSIYIGARFGVMGVHVWQGSNERQAATKILPQAAAVIGSVVRR